MKRILLLAAWICCFALNAQQRSMNQMRKLARQPIDGTTFKASDVVKDMKLSSGNEAFYILNNTSSTRGGKGGWSIVAADERVTPLIAYSHEGYLDPDNMPEAMREYLKQFVAEAEYVERTGSVLMRKTTERDESRHNIDPMISYIFTQRPPYNNLIPDGALVGCTAVGMATAMSRYEYPSSGHGNISYQYDYVYDEGGREKSVIRSLSIDLSDYPIDWNLIGKKEYNVNDPQEEKEAVARFIFAVAASIKTTFGQHGSSANINNVRSALINNFDYNPHMALYDRDAMSIGEWEDLLLNEIEQKRPIIMRGSALHNAEDKEWEGHCYVADGVEWHTNDNTPYFHINWGWGGWANGSYCRSTHLKSSAVDEYGSWSYDCKALINFQPESRRLESTSPLQAKRITLNFDHTTRATEDRQARLTIEGIFNRMEYQFDGELNVYLVNENKQEYRLLQLPLNNLQSNYGFDNYEVGVTVPAGAADGQYRLEARTLVSGEAEEMRVLSGNGRQTVILGEKNDAYTPSLLLANFEPDKDDIQAGLIAAEAWGLVNDGNMPFTGKLQLALADASGNIVSRFGNEEVVDGLACSSTSTSSFRLSGDVPDNVQNGEYRVYLMANQDGYDGWSIVGGCEINGGGYTPIDKEMYFTITVSGNSITPVEPDDPSPDDPSPDNPNPEDIIPEGDNWTEARIGGIWYQLWDEYLKTVQVVAPPEEDGPYSGDVVIPEQITINDKNYTVIRIGPESFSRATITSIKLPSTLKFISSWAFYYCEQLKSLVIPASVEEISEVLPFCDLFSLEAIEVEEGNTHFKAVDGVLYDYNMKVLYHYPAGKTDEKFVLPASVKRIIGWSVTSAQFSSLDLGSVEEIGMGAFSSCMSLTSLTVPETVTSLTSCAFRYCYSLAEINLPSKLRYIGNENFWGSKIKELTIPASVEEIDDYAFYTSTLEQLIFLGNTPKVSEEAFYDYHYDRVTLVVPDVNEYRSHAVWGKFAQIKASTFVSLNPKEKVMSVGETMDLICNRSEDLQALSLVWTSSDNSVATVTDGKVTAVGAGEADITVTCGERSASCHVTVCNEAVKKSVITLGGNKIESGLGFYDPVYARYAIRLTEDMLKAYKGKKISAVEVGLSESTNGVMPVICKDDNRNLVADQDAFDLESGWQKMQLTKPVEIDGSALYVGCAYKGDTFLGFAQGSMSGIYLDQGNGFQLEQGLENLIFCVRLHIEDAQLPMNAFVIAPDALDADKGETVTISGDLVNTSPEEIWHLSLKYYIDNELVAEKDYNRQLAKGELMNFEQSIKVPEVPGEYTLDIIAKDLNSMADAAYVKQINLYVMGEGFERRVVIEEGTGTWCPWCVVGIVGIEKMKEKYPDNFIAIGVHADDEMSNIENYEPIQSMFTSYPSALVNRLYTVYPSEYSLQEEIEKYMKKAKAKVEASMYQDESEHNTVVVDTKTIFGAKADNHYGLSYAVIENKVGPYRQANGYSGSDSPMGGFESMGARVSWLYDDVARGLYGSVDGVSGSLPDKIDANTEYEYSYKIQLPSNISNYDNVEVVVMLIDQINGEIVNAAKCSCMIKPNAISSVVEDAATVVRYIDAAGRGSDKPVKGLNIIQYSDGTSRKVLR